LAQVIFARDFSSQVLPLVKTLGGMKLVVLALCAAAAGAMELTNANWDSATAGKQVLIKFQAPW